jgi:predicted class III extradiol MEMO1 family dioxygenase
MKLAPKLFPVILSFLLLFCQRITAQSFETAVDYIDYITKASDKLTETYLVYLSAVSHGKSARKVEKKRQEVLNAISDTRFNIMGMPPFKGDRSLKDTTVAYLKILNYIFNDQYGKIVNMEEIAEQSYDGMEAYLMAQEKAQEKLQEASKKQHETLKQFAVKNNINLVEAENELEAKMKIANKLMEHSDAVYLIFYKCYRQEAYLLEAINKKNLVSIEQNNNSLKKFSEEGQEKLKAMKGYNNDPALLVACTDLMIFYKNEAGQTSGMSDFFLKEENFAKLKKQFDSRSERTQQDIDQYNKAVNETNAAMQDFNKTNNELNKARSSVLDRWNKAYKEYMDNYMPKQR